MMIWMSMSLTTDLHWWGPWWWSGWLCPWSITCIDEVPDDDFDVLDYWPLTCIDEVPDDDLDVYVPDHWPALISSLMMIWMSMSDHWPVLMRSLMMIWMSMSLITNLHWWGPGLWSGCLCPWSLTCIDEVPDDDLDVYVPDHWPALMRSLMMIWMSLITDHWPALMRSLMMIWMSMSLITDLHWWGPWLWSGCLCPCSLTCIDEVPDDDLDVYVPDHRPALMRSLMMISMSFISDHWPALMRTLMMIWMSMSLINDLY